MIDKTSDEIISEILDSQQSLDKLYKAEYACHMMNIVKILKKYGEHDLAELVQARLNSELDPKGEDEEVA